jgi:hypothetical protein
MTGRELSRPFVEYSSDWVRANVHPPQPIGERMMDDKLQEIFDDAERLKAALQKANADELKACPFCGRDDHLSVRSVGSLTADMPARPHRVVCLNIDHDEVLGPVAYGKAEAIAAWNTRPLTGGVTPEMVEAGWEAFNQHDDYRTAMREAYLAMRDAALRAREALSPRRGRSGARRADAHKQTT